MAQDRLTGWAKLMLARARNEALFFQHEEIQPEHILSALAGLPRCYAARLLRQLGLDLHIIVREVVAATNFGPVRDSPPNTRLSCASSRVLAQAAAEAAAFGAEHVGTEHILLGLMSEQNAASHVLSMRLGVSIDAARDLIGAGDDNDRKEGVPQSS